MRISVEVGNNFLNGSCAQTNWSILDVIDGLGLVRIYLFAQLAKCFLQLSTSLGP